MSQTTVRTQAAQSPLPLPSVFRDMVQDNHDLGCVDPIRALQPPERSTLSNSQVWKRKIFLEWLSRVLLESLKRLSLETLTTGKETEPNGEDAQQRRFRKIPRPYFKKVAHTPWGKGMFFWKILEEYNLNGPQTHRLTYRWNTLPGNKRETFQAWISMQQISNRISALSVVYLA